jgi:hypothetical protein
MPRWPADRPAVAFSETAQARPECAAGWPVHCRATRYTAVRLRACHNDARRRSPPSAGNLPGRCAPSAPDTSWPPARRSSLRALAVGYPPAETPPAPAAATPNSRYDQNAVPIPPGGIRSAAPTPPTATPAPAKGDGTFTVSRIPLPSTLDDCWTMLAGDFNGDGAPDVAVADNYHMTTPGGTTTTPGTFTVQ